MKEIKEMKERRKETKMKEGVFVFDCFSFNSIMLFV